MRKIFRLDAEAVVDDLHDRLVVVASGLNRDFTTAIYRVRCVIEQVDPHLRELARIAAHMTAFARKILRDVKVLELVIKNAQRAPDLLMHVNIRDFCALLSRTGTHRIDQVSDPPGALFSVIEQCSDRQPQSDPSHRVAKRAPWQIFANHQRVPSIQRRRAQERFSRRPSPFLLGARRQRILSGHPVRPSDGPLYRKLRQNLIDKGDQSVPMLILERVMQPMGDRLDRVNQFSEMHRDTLGSGGRVIQLMRKPGGHCAERLQLFLLSRRAFDVAKPRRIARKVSQIQSRVTDSKKAPPENDQPVHARPARIRRRAKQQPDRQKTHRVGCERQRRFFRASSLKEHKNRWPLPRKAFRQRRAAILRSPRGKSCLPP